MKLFRVLAPSWRFFDGPMGAPEVFFRTGLIEAELSEWQLGIPKTKSRKFKNLFVNADENFAFAAHALIEYLKNDLDEGANPAVSLALLENLVRFQIRQVPSKATVFQFKLSFGHDLSELYLSPILPMEESK